MKLKFHICLFLALFLALDCFDTSDLPYYYEVPICSNRIENSDTVPFYEFDKPMQPFDKRSIESLRVSEDTTSPPVLQAIAWKDLDLKDSDIPYLTILTSPQKANPNRKKRSVDEGKGRVEGAVDDSQQYGMEFLSPFHKMSHNADSIKTIQFPSSFTPRFGRKRFDPQATDNFLMSDTTNRFYVPSYYNRLVRSESAPRINLNGGSSFTPRLGRSEGYNRIQLSSGSAFTPRLGRSNARNLVQLTAGSAFTPRLGRSEGHSRVHVNAGNAFTPRLGRSESNPNHINLNAGSAFTPRLGRSEDNNRVQLNAGSAFTPRLGRSESNPNHINLSAGSAFTPRFGRSENHSKVQLNAGSAFTPRFGRSQDLQSISLNAGSAFTPRLGRSEQPNLISLNAGNAFTPRLG